MKSNENKEMNVFEVLACTNTALRRAARRLSNLYDDALVPLGLKATQVSLLSEIERLTASNEGQSPSLQSLADKLSIQISAVTHALRPLIRDGLIALKAHENDKRVKCAFLTPLGVSQLSKALEYWSTANNRVEAVLGAESAATLRLLSDHVASDEFLAEYQDAQSHH